MDLVLSSIERDYRSPMTDVRRVLKSLEVIGAHARKFIVLMGESKCYVVIGMKFVDSRAHEDFYMHRDLVSVSKSILDKKNTGKYVLRGGGVLAFRQSFSTGQSWQAEFGGSSSDYGVWDYHLLDHQQAIADELNMVVNFHWRWHIYPKSLQGTRGL